MAFAGGVPAKKNAEFLLIFPIYDADGDIVSGAAGLDSEVSKDGAGFTDCTNEASEIGSSGIYSLTLTADEMDADVIAVITKTSTDGAKTTPTVIYTSAYQIAEMRGTDGAITSLVAITGDKDSYKADVSGLPASIWNRLTSLLTTVSSIGKLLVDNIDAKVSSRTALGTGAITWTYTLTDADTGGPIADADIWITSDEAGETLLASGKTNQSGVATFYLDPGTVYIWRQKTGYDFTNPDMEVVT